ncbi:transporter substrate-binding domain-containing protein [Duganella sp. FT80W]|uniref:Transporter substrate-binding domain-containing protein n=1 Tax=Duganella guangzhouensis TaxID=2666084 RepID=A0A6I2L3T7_9BURK|nr:transporter substrate-binding domain-containing protein [Duganella guangzhouensis]MRW90909.1 transporter substrate-binding domain-containing protein [Duganella guangzhouensis]
MRCASLALALLLAVPAAAVAAAPTPAPPRESMRIFGAVIPPLSFMRDGTPTGYCVDLAHEIQRRIKDRTRVELLPWARAYRLAVDGANIMLICPKRTPEREPLFRWVGPVLESQSVVYALRSSRLRLGNLADLRALDGVLVPRDFYTHQYLRIAGFTNLDPVNSSQTMLAMLLAGRRKAMVLDREQLPFLLRQAGVSADVVEPVLRVMTIHSYFAFPLYAPDALVAQWQQALDQMRRDGTLLRIHRNWFPDLADSTAHR